MSIRRVVPNISSDSLDDSRGVYCGIERPKLLEFTWLADWQENAPLTVVRFDLDEKNSVTTVRLTHSGFAGGLSREAYQGWPWLLALLRTYAENKAAD